MGDALMPSFQQISSHRLQIIYSGIGVESFWVPWDLQSSVAGSLTIDSFGNTTMSPNRWILSSVWPQHIYSHLLVYILVPWFPFSLSVGDLASVNNIHQWPVIRQWTTMFGLDTSIHIVGHVHVEVCVEYFPYWWHFIYVTSLIMLVFMRFQLLWLDSSICQIYSSITEILIHCISSSFMDIMILCIYSSCRFWSIYIVCGNDHTCHILYHAYSWPLYSYVSGTVVCTCSHV